MVQGTRKREDISLSASSAATTMASTTTAATGRRGRRRAESDKTTTKGSVNAASGGPVLKTLDTYAYIITYPFPARPNLSGRFWKSVSLHPRLFHLPLGEVHLVFPDLIMLVSSFHLHKRCMKARHKATGHVKRFIASHGRSLPQSLGTSNACNANHGVVL